MKRKASDPSVEEINSRIRRLLEHAPSDSSAEIEMRKGAEGFQGLLRVSSCQGKFIGGARGRKFAEVIEEIFRQVEAQIDLWRGRREPTLMGKE